MSAFGKNPYLDYFNLKTQKFTEDPFNDNTNQNSTYSWDSKEEFNCPKEVILYL